MMLGKSTSASLKRSWRPSKQRPAKRQRPSHELKDAKHCIGITEDQIS